MSTENDTPVVETPAAETPAVETPAVDTPVTEGPKSIAEAVDAAVESAPKRGPEAPKDKADGDAGKVKSEKDAGAKQGDDKDADEDPAEAGDDKAKSGEGEEPDHLNDPIPKELSERAQERIRSLVGYVKERDVAIQAQGNVIKAISDTGISPEDFAETVGFWRLVNSQKPEDLRQALSIVQQQARGIALKLGEEVPGVDLLEGHPELQNAVKYGQITREHAIKVAQFENAQAAKRAESDRTRSEQQETAGLEAAKTQSIAVLNQIGVELQKSDPDYQRKFDALVGPLQKAFAHIHPAKWPDAFKAAWEAYKPAPATAAPTEAPAGMVRDPATGKFVKAAPKPTPIRPQTPAGSGTKAPSSMRDAIDSALAGLQR